MIFIIYVFFFLQMLNKYFGQGNYNIVKLYGVKQIMIEKQLVVGYLNDLYDFDIKNFVGY